MSRDSFFREPKPEKVYQEPIVVPQVLSLGNYYSIESQSDVEKGSVGITQPVYSDEIATNEARATSEIHRMSRVQKGFMVSSALFISLMAFNRSCEAPATLEQPDVEISYIDENEDPMSSNTSIPFIAFERIEPTSSQVSNLQSDVLELENLEETDITTTTDTTAIAPTVIDTVEIIESEQEIEIVDEPRETVQETTTTTIEAASTISPSETVNCEEEKITIEAGMVLGLIAEHCGLAPSTLAARNPGINPDKIITGATLYLSGQGSQTSSSQATRNSTTSTDSTISCTEYSDRVVIPEGFRLYNYMENIGFTASQIAYLLGSTTFVSDFGINQIMGNTERLPASKDKEDVLYCYRSR